MPSCRAGPTGSRSRGWSAQGGTFVRNEHWDPRTDPIRQAYPDEIHVTSGLGETHGHPAAAQPAGRRRLRRLVGAGQPHAAQPGGHRAAGSADVPLHGQRRLPRRQHAQQGHGQPGRAQGPRAVDEPRDVRDRHGWRGCRDADVVDPVADRRPRVGDAAAGRRGRGRPRGCPQGPPAGGRELPVPLRVVYARSVLGDKAYAALAAGWDRAGFDVQLTGVPPEEYYETIEKPTSVASYDVFRGVWTPDWPSAGGVLPALFDSRINIDSSGPGQDVGYFSSDAVNALIDKADATADPAARAKVWSRRTPRCGRGRLHRPLGDQGAPPARVGRQVLRGPPGRRDRRPRHGGRALTTPIREAPPCRDCSSSTPIPTTRR